MHRVGISKGEGDRMKKKSKNNKEVNNGGRLHNVGGRVRGPITASNRRSRGKQSFMPSPLSSPTHRGTSYVDPTMFESSDIDEDPKYDVGDDDTDDDTDDDIDDDDDDNGGDGGTISVADDDVGEKEPSTTISDMSFSSPHKVFGDGAPPIMELIPSYRSHVACFIFQGQDRGVLEGHNRYNKLKAWDVQEDTTRAMILESNLAHLRSLMYEYINMPLISAFLERWYPETNSFHLPFGEMSITLHDVWYLLRVPVQGEPVIPNCTDGPAVAREFASEYGFSMDKLEMMKDILGFSFGKVKYSGIKNLAEQFKDAPRKVANAYLLWLVNATLFVDKSRTYGSGAFIEVVRKNVKNSAWGTATLAYLYREMGIASRNDCRQISGCLTLLQSWIYAYFPGLSPKMSMNWNVDDPYAARWIPRKVSQDVELLTEHRRFLDCSTVDSVSWTPFSNSPAKEVPISLFSGIIHCGQVTEPYMPDRVVRQFGYVQDIPVPPLMPFKVKRGVKVKLYVVEHYPVVAYFKTWRRHKLNIDEYTLAEVNGQCDEGYLDWYIARTHPRVSPTQVVLEKHTQIPSHLHDAYVRMQQFAKVVAPYHPTKVVPTDHSFEEMLMKLGELAVLCEDMIPHVQSTM